MLDVTTVLTGEKRLAEAFGESCADGVAFRGYEMHMGRTTGPAAAHPLLQLADGRPDGACSADGLVSGTYVHGLFTSDKQRDAWLLRLGAAPAGRCHDDEIEAVLDALAAHLEAHIDVDALLRLAR